MKLTAFFDESTIHAKQLVELHDALDFREKRTRSEWRDKLFNNGIVDWGKREGVWRNVSTDGRVQIVGSNAKKAFKDNLSDRRSMLLQHALVMMLASIDKLLHQATISKNFVQLLRAGKFDNLMKNFPASETYEIAMESRVRRGYGGKTK